MNTSVNTLYSEYKGGQALAYCHEALHRASLDDVGDVAQRSHAAVDGRVSLGRGGAAGAGARQSATALRRDVARAGAIMRAERLARARAEKRGK